MASNNQNAAAIALSAAIDLTVNLGSMQVKPAVVEKMPFQGGFYSEETNSKGLPHGSEYCQNEKVNSYNISLI